MLDAKGEACTSRNPITENGSHTIDVIVRAFFTGLVITIERLSLFVLSGNTYYYSLNTSRERTFLGPFVQLVPILCLAESADEYSRNYVFLWLLQLTASVGMLFLSVLSRIFRNSFFVCLKI